MARDDMEGVKTRLYERRSILMIKGPLYDKMSSLSKGKRTLLDFILKNMTPTLNTISLGGDTRAKCLEETKLTTGTISVFTSELVDLGFIEKTGVPYEYLVDPRLAIAGDEEATYYSYTKLENQAKEKAGIKVEKASYRACL
jgi:hypothetical protein